MALAVVQPPAVVLLADAAALLPESVPQAVQELHVLDERLFAEQSSAGRVFPQALVAPQLEPWPQEHPQVLRAWLPLVAVLLDAEEQPALLASAC